MTLVGSFQEKRRLKIAKGLQSVKYFLLQYPQNPKVGPNWRGNFLTSILLQNKKK